MNKMPNTATKALIMLAIVTFFPNVRGKLPKSFQCVNSENDIETYFIHKTSEDQNYYKWIKPSDKVVNVMVSMQINRIAFYKDVESTFDIQILFELEWTDHRLQFSTSDCPAKGLSNFTLEGNEWHFSRIWSPNLRVTRNKETNVLKSKILSQIIFLRINSTGQVRVRIRSNLNLVCPMDYRNYPFDSQTCKISLISNDLTKEKLVLRWHDHEQFIIDDNLYMSSHSLDNFKILTEETRIKTEIFSKLTVELYLRRQWGHYMLVVFLPSMLIVATSWLSFWIEITSPPARITLCVTTMLALVTVSKEVRQDLPKVPYIKATDLWFAGCTVSIFLSLIEYILVAYTFREEKEKYKQRKKFKRSLSSVSLSSLETANTLHKLDTSSFYLTPMESDRFGRRYSANCVPSSRNSLPSPQHRIQFTFSPPESPNNATVSPSEMELSQLYKETPQEVAESIDRKCRIIFPLFFALFNLIYWSYLS